MKKIFFMSCILVLISVSAFAHSTAGRIKTDLDKKNPGIDDFAYFSEPYVTHHLFLDKMKNSKKRMRFFLKEFNKINLENKKAFIKITVLDIKTHETFPYTLEFERDKSGKWYFNSPDNKKVKVFTYVTKKAFYYDKYIFPLSLGGIFILGFLFLFLRIKKNTGKIKCLKSSEN